MLAGYDHLLRAADRLRWDEAQIDLRADAYAWHALAPALRDPLTRLFAGFWLAEHAVAEQLAPFEACAGKPELAACFAAQANDERRHARFFTRVAREVMGIDPARDGRRLAGAAIVDLFEHDLPAAAGRLAAGERDLPEAVALYHLVLEGIVFDVGQQAALELLDRAGTLPGVGDGMARVQGDERWHVGLGVLCLAEAGIDAKGVKESLTCAGRAAAAWGEAVPPGLVATALRRHRRRLAEAGRGHGAGRAGSKGTLMFP